MEISAIMLDDWSHEMVRLLQLQRRANVILILKIIGFRLLFLPFRSILYDILCSCNACLRICTHETKLNFLMFISKIKLVVLVSSKIVATANESNKRYQPSGGNYPVSKEVDDTGNKDWESACGIPVRLFYVLAWCRICKLWSHQCAIIKERWTGSRWMPYFTGCLVFCRHLNATVH